MTSRPRFDGLPEWITVHEAAYVARVGANLLLEWATIGRVRRVSLVPGDDPSTTLLNVADVRAAMVSEQPPGSALRAGPGRWSAQLPAPPPPVGITRRSVIAFIGAMLAATAIPVRALGAGSASDPPTADVAKGDTVASKAGGGSSPPGDKGAKPGTGPIKGSSQTPLQITSVQVQPNPVQAGGEALITITASPPGNDLTYTVSASEGTVVPDPSDPRVWRWIDA